VPFDDVCNRFSPEVVDAVDLNVVACTLSNPAKIGLKTA